MNSEFSTFKLGDVADIIAGGDKPKIFSVNKSNLKNVPVFANAEKNCGLLGYTDSPRIVESAVTVAARGSNVGFVAVRKEPFFPVVRLLALIPRGERLDVDYLFYNLKQNRQNGTGSGQPQITIPDISNKVISLPSIVTQQKVAKVLYTLDAKIELNNRINAELEAMAKTLYDYWFVQFDFPDANGKPYKTSGGKMVYNAELKRDVPEGWEPVSVSDILNIKTGKEDANYATDDGRYHFFTCGEAPLRCDDFVFDGKAVLLAGNGSFAVKRYDGKFNAYQRTYVLIPSEGKYFAPLYFSVLARVQSLITGSRGSIVKFITKGDIESIYIPLPLDRKIYFSSILGEIFSKSANIYNENLELIKLRDWLLPMLMNGQIIVS